MAFDKTIPKTSHPLYNTWRMILTRCYDTKYDRAETYRLKGIIVCDRWKDEEEGFKSFVEDMGDKPSPTHTVDRIDSQGNYTPDNCRWASKTLQALNHSPHKNSKIGLMGVQKHGERYRARTNYKRKRIHIGVFDTAELAHEAYKEVLATLIEKELAV